MNYPIGTKWFVQFENSQLLASDGETATIYIDDAKKFDSYDGAYDSLKKLSVMNLAKNHSAGPTVGRIVPKR
jgi:hypothetical protein